MPTYARHLPLLVLLLILGTGCAAEHEGDEPGECTDGADNDLDEDFDCNDSGCAGSPDCAGGDDDDAVDDDDSGLDDDDAADDDDDDSGLDDDDAADDDDGPPPGLKVVGYFAEWGVYDRNFQVSDIPTDLVTHVNYAFIDVQADGLCHLYDEWGALSHNGGNLPNLAALKTSHPDLEVLLSVGGWSLSTYFSDVALTPASRAAFAASCVAFVVNYGFDGLDIDWEYPVSGGLASNIVRHEDKTNYTLLLQELRTQLDAIGPNYRLTIAGPAGPSTIDNMDLPALAEPLDWINVMTYDLAGSWSTNTGFNGALYPPASAVGDDALINVDSAIQTYLAAGVPPEKLVVGLPFYGRGFSAVGATDNGLGQPFTGIPDGTWEPGILDYHDLQANYVSDPSFTRYFDNDSLVPWLYSPTRQVMISYDDGESVGHKLDYILDNGLGGAMYWEMSGDTATNALTQQISDALVP